MQLTRQDFPWKINLGRVWSHPGTQKAGEREAGVLQKGKWYLQKCGSRIRMRVDKPRKFPGGPVATNPPFNAGDRGSIPSRGTKIPYATGQLSLHATTTDYALEPPGHN